MPIELHKAESAERKSRMSSSESRSARICMPTARGFTRRAFQCGLYEAQDVVISTDDVDLLMLEPGPGFSTKMKWQRKLLYRDLTKQLINVNPGIRPVRLQHDYELFLVVCQNYWDFLYINAIEGWKDRCRTSVLLIDELWAPHLSEYKFWLHALRQFDHVFVGYAGTAAPLSRAIDYECQWLPGAVDALRFTPAPHCPTRSIDVYSIGRRFPGVHASLRGLAAAGDFFYVHDTFVGSDMQPSDHREHRELYANMAKRSRFFMVAPGKMDATDETGGQVEIGYRYYEGCAAGAILLGQVPECDSFYEMFGWTDSVVPIRTDGSDTVAVLSELLAQPERMHAISRENTIQALLRHDWVYRWKDVYKVAGIPSSQGMLKREARLKALATSTQASS